MKALREIEIELTRLRLLEPQLLRLITILELENKNLRKELEKIKKTTKT